MVLPCFESEWGRVDALCERKVALFQRAGEVDVAGLVAEVDLLVEDADEAVFDGEVDLGAVFDGLGEGAFGGYVEGFAAVGRGVEVVSDVVGGGQLSCYRGERR